MATRRQFLQLCAAGPLASHPVVYAKTPQLASAYQASDEAFGIAYLKERGSTVRNQSLPGRGHDCVFSPMGERLIVFSRRPGDWFAVMNNSTAKLEFNVAAAPGRHFYGHGRFSADGRLFYATENDYENAKGIIGLYDVTNGFQRMGEFPSGGVGPHDLMLSSDEKTLIVASGGIETHPDYGREKLNLASMRSSLMFLNSQTGTATNSYYLPPSLQRLSIRHLAQSTNGDCYFAGQYQGADEDTPPLVGCCRRSGHFELWDSPKASVLLRNYVTSIAVDPAGKTVATTSAKGGVVIFWDADTGEIKTVHQLPDCSGVAATADLIYVTSSSGLHKFSIKGDAVLELPRQFTVIGAWDNHLAISGG